MSVERAGLNIAVWAKATIWLLWHAPGYGMSEVLGHAGMGWLVMLTYYRLNAAVDGCPCRMRM